jgi:hypothetical protein
LPSLPSFHSPFQSFFCIFFPLSSFLFLSRSFLLKALHVGCFRFTLVAFVSLWLLSFHFGCFCFTLVAFVSLLSLTFHVCCFRFMIARRLPVSSQRLTQAMPVERRYSGD